MQISHQIKKVISFKNETT